MRTAVFLRGHPRTWNYIANQIITVYNLIYDPDWYVVMPRESTTVTEESIRRNFEGSRLCSLQFLDSAQYPFNTALLDVSGPLNTWQFRSPSYWRPAWYDYHANLAKRQWELQHNFSYDCVLGIRPDCWPFLDPRNKIAIERARTPLDSLQISDISQQGSVTDSDWHTPDLTWRAGAWAADLYCMRLWDCYYTDGTVKQATHFHEFSLPLYYCARNYIKNRSNYGTLTVDIIRPSLMGAIPQDWRELKKDRSWVDSSNDEKRRLCTELGIDPRDYNL